MASNPQHEPTMEEILASIRKIISEDSPEAAPAAPAAPVETAPEPSPAAAPAAAVEPAHEEPEVLELTQEVPHEEPVEPEPVKPAPVVQAAAPKAPEPEDDVVFQAVDEPAAAASSDHDDIFSDKTRGAIHDTFSNIQPPAVEEKPAAAPAPAAPAFTAKAGSSVEAVFERAISEAFDPVLHQWMDANKGELLNAVKPLIREWMDEHFPALLEGAVRNEVERVVKARGR
ncbi:MAG TPA: DUF2497 domain-containing protein [Rhizomicrobium sp.]|jgi:hypothetical protein